MSVNGRANLSDVKAVIFDYGEVLCFPPKREDIEGSAQILGADADLFWTLWHRHRDPYDRADISAEIYWGRVAGEAGRSIDARQIHELTQRDLAMWSRLNPRMLGWRENLSLAGLKTAVLSNMNLEMVQYARRNFPWLDGLNWATFSAEVKLIKPQPAIYKHCLRGLRLAPSETLFIDDREVNLAAARTMGIHGIQFRSIAQLRTDLEASGFPTLPPDTATIDSRAT